MRGLLFAQMTPPPDRAEFDAWYDREHIPVRLELDGFERAVRSAALGDEIEHLICYLLDDMDVLDSEAYTRIKTEPGDRTRRMLAAVTDFTRYTATALGDSGPAAAPASTICFLFPGPGATAPTDHDDDVERWCRDSLATRSRALDGWLRTHWYRTVGGHDGPPLSHIGLVDLASPEPGPATRQLVAELVEGAPIGIRTAWYRTITEAP